MTLGLGFEDTCAIREEAANAIDNECTKILKLAIISLKSHSNAFYKENCSLDNADLESIKQALINYRNTQERSDLFKKELIENISGFQTKLREKSSKQISSLQQQIFSYKKEILKLKEEIEQSEKKTSLIEKFAQTHLNANSIRKQLEAKISLINLKIENLQQQINKILAEGAVASEKDILLYQMELKEKYSIL